jgi:hypothetical protein
MSACTKTPQPVKIALLAPFEGRYREVGYDALYAARLALADSPVVVGEITLLPIDDGGDISSAVERAEALRRDPAVKSVLGLGYAATSDAVQAALGDVPVLIVGYWGARPQRENAYILASPDLHERVTTPARAAITDLARLPTPLRCGPVCGLAQFPQLRDDLSDISVLSSSSLPDAVFRQRYVDSAQFAPEPGLLATLTYDATMLAVQSVNAGVPLDAIESVGINGRIRFADDDYWQDAPINRFAYEDAVLRSSTSGP